MKDIQIFVIGILLGILFGFVIGGGVVNNTVKKQSLKGYKATAIYSTNSLGEVRIDEIKWTK